MRRIQDVPHTRTHAVTQPSGPSSGRGRAFAACLVLALSLAGSPAAADRYDSRTAGNPIRIAAYVVHPIGVALDYLIMRPAHWLFSKEPLKTIVGHED